MKTSTRRFLIAVATAAVTTASALAVTLTNPAAADDAAPISPNTPESMPVDQIYGAIGRVKKKNPEAVNIGGFGDFGLTEEYRRQLQIDAQKAWTTYLGWLNSIGKAGQNLKSFFPDANIDAGEPGDPMYANWTFKDGSDTIEQPGGTPTTTTKGDNSFTLTPTQFGIQADFSAKATVQGNTTVNVQGGYGIDFSGGTYGTIGIHTFNVVEYNGETLNLGLYGEVKGNAMSASVGPTSYSAGVTGKSSDGQGVMASAAVGPDGEVLGLSLGGTVHIDGIPAAVQVRVDINNSGGSVTAEPAPGVSVSGGNNGFSLTVDVNTFSGWLNNMINGR